MILPAPLKSDTIIPRIAVPPKATAIFAALLITSSPAEFNMIVHTTKIQNFEVFSISAAV